MTQNVLPTLDRLHKFLPNVNLDYLICGDHPETIEHLVFECPLSKLLWWNSPHRSILWNEIRATDGVYARSTPKIPDR